MSSSNHPSRSRHTASTAVRLAPPSRPSSINELAELAFANLWDPSKDFKHWLRIAERSRNTGKEYAAMGDLENAFVEYAKAATLILDKMPGHREYGTRLNTMQKDSLTLHGQELLRELASIKPILTDRYNKWLSSQASGSNSARELDASPTHQRRAAEHDSHSSSNSTLLSHSQLYSNPLFVDADTLTKDPEPAPRRLSVQHDRGPRPLPSTAQAQAKAAALSIPILEPDRKRDETYDRATANADVRKEQAGILQRRYEAEMEARAARQFGTPAHTSTNNSNEHAFVPVSSLNLSHSAVAPSAVPLQAANSQSSDSSAFSVDFLPILPLESPRRYDGDSSTDTEKSDNERGGLNTLLHDRFSNMSLRSETPEKGPFASLTHTPPITTTSAPPPSLGTVQYPQLMTQHQRTQGYTPSLQSMFIKPGISIINTDAMTSSLLFDNPHGGHTHPPISGLYNNILPEASRPVDTSYDGHLSNYYPGPQAPPSNGPPPSVPPRPQDPYPPKPSSLTYPQNQTHVHPYSNSTPPQSRIVPSESRTKDTTGFKELKTVNVPKLVLPRFLAIAAANTAKNRETCGLLLGRPKAELESGRPNGNSSNRGGGKGDSEKFVVTTLLIPRQHATSDTCTMDEEELVLEFTVTRGLITLGWIHTHPTQSCFMSSVDLHTHSGFQRMLPESFAIVCAPRSTPNFGIFRLTDPPGLQTVLNCHIKDAFHPHPDVPIYTDADKGHVQMRDMSLEIVDLR